MRANDECSQMKAEKANENAEIEVMKLCMKILLKFYFAEIIEQVIKDNSLKKTDYTRLKYLTKKKKKNKELNHMVAGNIAQTSKLIRTAVTWVSKYSKNKSTVKEKKDKPW